MLNNQNQPLVSVIMSVYNGEKYLKEAIDSILKQSYKKFEFIIINDGSTDNSFNILKKYKEIDNRIVLVENSTNKGLIYSLNKGLSISKGDYIARMDADDISEKKRFEEQVNFLNENKEIAMCGTYIKMFKNNWKFLKKNFKTETDFEKIRIQLLFRNYIAHPTVMIRKNIIKKYDLKYDLEDKGMEDYSMWLYLIQFEKIGIIPKYLLKYRFLGNSISSKTLKDFENHKMKLKNIYRKNLNSKLKLTEKELEIHTEISLTNNIIKYNYSIDEKIQYLNKLSKKFEKFVEAKNILELYKNEVILNQIDGFEIFKLKYILKMPIYLKIKLKRCIKKLLR